MPHMTSVLRIVPRVARPLRASSASWRHLATRAAGADVIFKNYGKFVFRGAVSAPYLERQGLSRNVLDTPEWTQSIATADKVAAAILEWAKDNGATSYCHWFQPLGSSILRHGLAGQVQNRMLEFDAHGQLIWKFEGKHLLRGETDGSSYPSGGLRSTHRAGGYTCVDPTSPIFIREDAVYIPAAFVSYLGDCLDEKTPLLRSLDALADQGARLLKLLGFRDEDAANPLSSVQSFIGLEQEFFFIPRDAYLNRTDLQLAGRTVLGRLPPRGQEASDHYMSPISLASPALACMQEIQEECFKLGIPLKTRHREVAPNQYELVPLFGHATSQVDQNILLMQIVEEVAVKHNLAALFHEKPFQGVNGSGKHNNWSLRTNDGTNIFNIKEVTARVGSPLPFIVIISALARAVHKYGDIILLGCSSPGNDFRLGACEAPPAIMSLSLGESMTAYLKNILESGDFSPYSEPRRQVSVGARGVGPIEVPAQDRNRTSPFPFINDRFEVRAQGSSQNASLINTMLATICAKTFKETADALEAGKSPEAMVKEYLTDSWKVLFNGNGYDPAEQQRLISSGVWYTKSIVDAMQAYTSPKNVELFAEMKVLSAVECAARQRILLDNYSHVVEIEANCIVDMVQHHVLPSLRRSAHDGSLPREAADALVNKLALAVGELKVAMERAMESRNEVDRARLSREIRLGMMLQLRALLDEAESVVPAEQWSIATYKELLFMDQHHSHEPSRTPLR